MKSQILEVEAESLQEARAKVKSQLPEAFYVVSETLIADGSEETVSATGENTDEAFRKAESKLPAGSQVTRKDELKPAQEKSIIVEAFDEDSARSQLMKQCGINCTIKSLDMTVAGKRGFLGFGRKPNQFTSRVLLQACVEIRYKRMPKISAKIAKYPDFFRDLRNIREDGWSTYEHDRNKAFSWFDEQGFSSPELNTLECANYSTDMSLMAYDKSIWKEAWAGFHRALASYIHLEMENEIPDIVWRLGRAHTGLGNYVLADLYLQAANLLSENVHNKELHELVLLEQAVLSVLQEDSSAYEAAIDRVFSVFFPHGKPIANASKAAFTLFDEGGKNQQWRREGQPVRSCQIHATGFYRVSLDMNRKLQDRRAIGFTLINLGDIANELNWCEKALSYWKEAHKVFQDLRDEESLKLIEERLNSL